MHNYITNHNISTSCLQRQRELAHIHLTATGRVLTATTVVTVAHRIIVTLPALTALSTLVPIPVRRFDSITAAAAAVASVGVSRAARLAAAAAAGAAAALGTSVWGMRRMRRLDVTSAVHHQVRGRPHVCQHILHHTTTDIHTEQREWGERVLLSVWKHHVVYS